MVSCFKCMEKLPDECTCKISERTKLKHYLESVVKEAQLIKAILFENFTPTILAGKKTVTPNIKETEKGVILWIDLNPDDWRKVRSFILLDLEGHPLYRRTLRHFNIHCSKEDFFTLTWELGIA